MTPEAARAPIAPEQIYDFAGVARCWGLSEGEQRALLGGVDATVYERWRLGDFREFSGDAADRIALVFEIFGLLQQVEREPVAADDWVRRPCCALEGRIPLEIMRDGLRGLNAVRIHLTALVSDRV